MHVKLANAMTGRLTNFAVLQFRHFAAGDRSNGGYKVLSTSADIKPTLGIEPEWVFISFPFRRV
jgi:hypothetical protein